MAFSPAIYGPRTAAALDALHKIMYKDKIERKTSFWYYTIIPASGTMLEADLLLSCSDVMSSPVYRLFKYNVEIRTELTDIFAPEKDKKISDEIIAHSIVEFRRSIRGVFNKNAAVATVTTTIDSFSDTLFGPCLAKVLNGLLILEIKLANARPTDGLDTYYRATIEKVDSHSPPAYQPFALQSEKGTAFAGDLLLLQYSLSSYIVGDMVLLFPEESALLMKALFPEFKGKSFAWDQREWEDLLPELEKPRNAIDRFKFNSLIGKALGEARREMEFVVNVIHGRALVILMAGNRRLGENSPLGALDTELLRMIARMLIWG